MIERAQIQGVEPKERFLQNPPQLILIFDNWRGEGNNEKLLSRKTMAVRASIASKFAYSTLYTGQTDSPILACFAGEHTPGDIPGSKRVTDELRRLSGPDSKIVTRQNTITTVLDLMALHAYAKAHGITRIVIATTRDHVKRARLEVKNHFGRRGNKDKSDLQIEVIGPQSKILNSLKYRADCPPKIQREIENWINMGKTSVLDGDRKESAAIVVAAIPHRKLRRTVQRPLEARGHEHTPKDLARIIRVAEIIYENSKSHKEESAA